MDAVQKKPLHWGAWKELALLITDKETVCRLGGVEGKGEEGRGRRSVCGCYTEGTITLGSLERADSAYTEQEYST